MYALDDLKEKDFFRNKKVVVTGGCGFIGSHLVQSLVDLGADVTVIDNLTSGKVENIHSVINKVKLIIDDIRKPGVVEKAGKFDILFNEAATSLIPSFKDPLGDLHVNTGGIINVLEAARKFDSKVIHASSGSVYGNPIRIPIDEEHPLNPVSPYGVSKLAAEYYCKLYFQLYGLNVSCLRYFNVYGPRQRIGEETGVIPIFVSRIFFSEPITIFGDGFQTRDFLHVTDCVRANLLAAISENIKGLAINIGGKNNEVKILDLAYMIMKLLNKRTQIIFKDPKPGDVRRLVADISKAKTLLRYEPKISIEEGLLDYINYFRSYVKT